MRRYFPLILNSPFEPDALDIVKLCEYNSFDLNKKPRSKSGPIHLDSFQKKSSFLNDDIIYDKSATVEIRTAGMNGMTLIN